ncbi:DUF3307 domain-containing protein [candidate division KSB1 bacterium]|nr:DUF3307 domain-containing protein [candidate division KSB1 bacterium]
MIKLIAVLIAVHAISDFFLQTDKLSNLKKKFGFLLIHAAIHAVLTYVALQKWSLWQVPLLVFIVHTLIDYLKQRMSKETSEAFIADQIFHFLSLFILAWMMVRFAWLPAFTGFGYKTLIILAGFIATVKGSGILISKFTKQLTDTNDLQLDGLINGGKWIGQLERALIFMLIFIGQSGGIGFLVAAKSILRFEEAKKQKLAEYVLIGTLMSFSLAIAIAWITKWAVDL